MKRFILKQSDDELYTSHSGLALAGFFINRYSDLLRSYLGLLCLGKSDYEPKRAMRDDDHFKKSLGITNMPSAEWLRQRLDEEAEKYLDLANTCSVTMLKNGKAHPTTLDTGHIPLDVDVFPKDNFGTKEEKVSYTYKEYFSYAPRAANLGLKGWCPEVELRPGSQHCQEGFTDYNKRVFAKARVLTNKKSLVRLDSGRDAIKNRGLLRKTDKMSSHIIKWPPSGRTPVNCTKLQCRGNGNAWLLALCSVTVNSVKKPSLKVK